MRAEVIGARRTRQRFLAGQQGLVASLEALLFRHDPIGINVDHNTDEYRSEAETIAVCLREAATESDVQRIVHEEFVRWFGVGIAGPSDRYGQIAREAWRIWQTHR